MSFKEKFELETLEKEISLLEKEKKDLEEKMNTELPHDKMAQVSKRYYEVNLLLEEKSLRWITLS